MSCLSIKPQRGWERWVVGCVWHTLTSTRAWLQSPRLLNYSFFHVCFFCLFLCGVFFASKATYVTFNPVVGQNASWSHSVLGQWATPNDVADGAAHGMNPHTSHSFLLLVALRADHPLERDGPIIYFGSHALNIFGSPVSQAFTTLTTREFVFSRRPECVLMRLSPSLQAFHTIHADRLLCR